MESPTVSAPLGTVSVCADKIPVRASNTNRVWNGRIRVIMSILVIGWEVAVPIGIADADFTPHSPGVWYGRATADWSFVGVTYFPNGGPRTTNASRVACRPLPLQTP